ncbi:branched-chain amino acid ABC transporter permease [Paraburkholderia diazotrophica]|uniref:Amino acid/amide ABC transporter membrane protein 1, HAAT family n=1 Tax=Paraburkholderia diazotrophica TaxID=667676 RepID=A0A1H7ECF3_9BURK|nr:branched-chain amino acid ABC transporter permease [Paraburkholderia diazotrophica]SEK11314.1 amino acid/amide ABC transporter membrane protein 1, HAAT family [Paraburkholderia diazotrophica]
MNTLANIVVQGVLLGALYGLFAMGQSLVFGVMRLTNTAHGDFIVLLVFVLFALTSLLHVPLALSLVLLLVIAFGAGYAVQYTVLNRVSSRDPLPSLIVTFGLSIVIQNVLQQLFSADPRSIATGSFEAQSVTFAGITAGYLPLVTLGATVALAFAMQWLFGRTPLGRAFRATSDDREIVQLMGVSYRRTYALAMGIAFVLIAVAAALYSMRTAVSPTDGPALLLFAFEAVIIGGMGSFWGTFAGGMALGIAQQIGVYFDPGWGIWFGHIVFLCVLVVRPQGLLPKTA